MKHFTSFRSVIFLLITIVSVIIIAACSPDKTAGTTDVINSTSASGTSAVSPSPTPEPTPSPTPSVDLSLFAIEPQYSYAEAFNKDGYAVVYKESDPQNVACMIIDESGLAVFGPVEQVFLDDSPNLSLFCENGKYGYINSKLEVVIEPEYDSARLADEDGCCPVQKNGKWGRIDEANQWVCLPQFREIRGYYSDGTTGFFGFLENGAWGVADRFGHVIIEPEYSFILLPNEVEEYGIPEWDPNKTGLFMICTWAGEDRYKCGLADKHGNIILEPVAEYGFVFADNGLAAVMIDGKMGYVNAKGKIVIKPQYEWASMFNSEGRAEVSFEDGSYAYIDETGRILDAETVEENGVFEFTYEGISFGTKDGVTGLFNSKGECVFDSQGIYPIMEKISGKEVYLFTYENKTIILDLEGKVISEYPVIVEHYFSKDDTFIFREDGKYGMMDADGNRRIEPVFERVYGDWNTNDHEGGMIINYSDRELVMTLVYDSNTDSAGYGILSSDGKELMPPISPNYITVSANGMVPVQVGDLFGYIRIDLG
ncbi:MAG: WG repeat-containing protein [Clostridiaceae bacterium]|nr:WG repeat-containing protein [Clostridiaceae bacterium]